MSHIVQRLSHVFRGKVVQIEAKSNPRGRALLSFTTLPFVRPDTIDGHSNRWECFCMANTLVERGFTVDVVDADNLKFIPKKTYDICIDTTNNLKRWNQALGPTCLKLFHATAAHWLFQNKAEYERLNAIKERRGFVLEPRRLVAPSYNPEQADHVSALGNEFTISTYTYAGKPVIRIPISSTHTYPFTPLPDPAKNSRSFIWIGGAGMAHKGLDLVLEAFRAMPDIQLTVFGKKDTDFAEAYKAELYQTANIHYKEHIDPASQAFIDIATTSAGVVFPSCSEGGGGSVIVAMHAGCIPIVSREASVDTADFGITLRENTVEEIKKQVQAVTQLPTTEIEQRRKATWNFVTTHHTRELFKTAFADYIDKVVRS